MRNLMGKKRHKVLKMAVQSRFTHEIIDKQNERTMSFNIQKNEKRVRSKTISTVGSW